MGATSISMTLRTDDFDTAFARIQKEAGDRFTGRYAENASYSGDWNTVSMRRPKKIFDKYNAKEANQWVRKNWEQINEDIDKREGVSFDLGIVEYQLVKVEKEVNRPKTPAVYATRYDVIRYDSNTMKDHHQYFETQNDAYEQAKVLTLKYPSDDIEVVKTKKLVSGEEQHTTFTCKTKVCKTKPKSIPAGAKLKEIHEYFCVGMAAD